MVQLAADAAKSHEFHGDSLRVSLAVIARRSYEGASTAYWALEEGWTRAPKHVAEVRSNLGYVSSNG